MSSYEYADRLKETVKKLSDFLSLEELHHQRCRGEVLPSEKQLQELISLCRSLIFPGFYGLPDVSKENLLYHTGINTENFSKYWSNKSQQDYYSKKIPIIQTAI